MVREMVERWVDWMVELKGISLVERSVTTMVDAMVVQMADQSALQPVGHLADERDYKWVGCLVVLSVA